VVLYIDLNSPYAYLSAERLTGVELEPILLGAIFERRGWGSWGRTDEREARIAEIDERARSYGLPPLAYYDGWPGNGLTAMRAATWAKQQGMVEPFALAVFRRQFVDGVDCTGIEELAAVGESVGLDGVREAVQTQAVKDALRASTDAAWEAGVRGIPTLRDGDRLVFGDDQM
jgi:2-hydroxychromene-2-carboxylate isomerase